MPMSQYETSYCVTIGDKYELECNVRYGFTPADPGVRYYPDGSGCPPTPAEVEVLEVEVETLFYPEWTRPGDPLHPCLVYPTIDRDWFVDRGWDKWIDEIAFRVLDAMAWDDTDFCRKLVDEAENYDPY